MRPFTFMVWCMATGWYIRWSGIDEEVVRAAQDIYKLGVLHTYKIVHEANKAIEEEKRAELAS